MAETVSDALLARLIDWGVDTIFGLPGDGINGFMEALRKRREDVRFVHTRHEETAALAACGYAKFTGRLGVCLSTAAPGAIHLLNGLYDAMVDQAPVLAITGMTYHDLIGTKYLQDLNHDYLFADVASFNQRLSRSTTRCRRWTRATASSATCPATRPARKASSRRGRFRRARTSSAPRSCCAGRRSRRSSPAPAPAAPARSSSSSPRSSAA
jgi:thiamine pyrophosphate-dependent acetolactate synthase large subunit-like protein